MTREIHSIMIIDDHPIIHDGLRTLLNKEPDMDVIDIAASATEALEKLKIISPDLAIVDLSMGDSDGTYLIQRIHSIYPDLKMLVYTMSEERLFAERTHMAGASAYIMKTTHPTDLKKAIRSVLKGNTCYHPDIQRRIDKKKDGGKSEIRTLLDLLSNREMDVFKLLGEGQDSVSIGEKLNISRNTVDTHRINIKNKLELPNGKALERLAYDTLHENKPVTK